MCGRPLRPLTERQLAKLVGALVVDPYIEARDLLALLIQSSVTRVMTGSVT